MCPCAPGNMFSLLPLNGGLAGAEPSLRQESGWVRTFPHTALGSWVENRFHAHLVFNLPSHHVDDFAGEKKSLVSLTEG